MTAANVDLLVEVLDRAERQQFAVWRRSLADLTEQLSKAQRVRRWVATPLLGAAVAVPQLWSESSLPTWVAASALVGTFFMWLMQQALERAYPVLAREARIDSLRGFFAPWRDEDTEVDLASRRRST